MQGILGIETAMLKDKTDNRLGQKGQAKGGRDGQQKGHGQGRDIGGLQGPQIPRRGLTGDNRQRGNRDGDAKDADGELHQTKGIVEPGDAPLSTPGGKVGIDKDVDLGGGEADHRRDHQNHDPRSPSSCRLR